LERLLNESSMNREVQALVCEGLAGGEVPPFYSPVNCCQEANEI